MELTSLPELIKENRDLRDQLTDTLVARCYGNMPGWVIMWPVLEIATLAYDIIEMVEERDCFLDGEAESFREAIASMIGASAQ